VLKATRLRTFFRVPKGAEFDRIPGGGGGFRWLRFGGLGSSSSRMGSVQIQTLMDARWVRLRDDNLEMKRAEKERVCGAHA
jgi:hypothetical protein